MTEKKVGCDECDWTGWILIEQPHGQLIAKKCKCYEEYLEEKDRAKWNEKFKGRKT